MATSDQAFMQLCQELAAQALVGGNAPVGAVSCTSTQWVKPQGHGYRDSHEQSNDAVVAALLGQNRFFYE